MTKHHPKKHVKHAPTAAGHASPKPEPKKHDPAPPKDPLRAYALKEVHSFVRADKIDPDKLEVAYIAAIYVHGGPLKRHVSDDQRIEFVQTIAAANP